MIQVLGEKTAFIFDMDDLLIRSVDLWNRAIQSLLAFYGQSEANIENLKYRGLSADDTAKLLASEFRLGQPLEEIRKNFSQCLLEQVSRHGVDALPGSVETVRWASEKGPVAVASGSPRPVIESVLDRLGLSGKVSVILSSHEVERGKPFPDVFLAAAAQLGIDPQNCVVFEDSLVGVRAAAAAGMRCVAVPSECVDDISGLAEWVFEDLHDIEEKILR